MSMAKKIVIAMVVGFVMVQAASALPVTFYRVDGYYSGNGGEFTAIGTPYVGAYDSSATATIPSGATGFQTFCLELNESLSFGTLYDYPGLENAAVQGGLGGGSPDEISWGTAWLYSQFAAGSLAGYDYTPGASRSSSAGLLQQAIWWLEHEVSLGNPGGNAFIAAAIAQFGSEDDARASAVAGAYGVHVINPVNNQAADRQSVLVVVRVADGGLTLFLLGSGVMTCVALRRKLAA